MSSHEESDISPQIPGLNLDSGFDSLLNPQPGSFGEGYPSGLDHYDWNDAECDQAYISLDAGPLSLQPASLQPLTMGIDSIADASEINSDLSNGNSQAIELSDACSSSTNTCTTSTDGASGTDATLNASHGNSGRDQHVEERQRHSTGNTHESAGDTIGISSHCKACENLPEATEIDEEGPPSPVLSNVRAQALKYVEIIIRSSVNESHPEVISERMLVESAHSNPPTSNSDAT